MVTSVAGEVGKAKLEICPLDGDGLCWQGRSVFGRVSIAVVKYHGYKQLGVGYFSLHFCITVAFITFLLL